MAVLISFTLLIGIFDTGMGIWAHYELKNSIHSETPWLIETQILEPDSIVHDHSVILVHGFAGSPFDFKQLAGEIRDKGFRVVVPMMPGQGRTISAYQRGNYDPEFYVAWLKDIVRKETESTGNKPYLVGFSMGGTISTIIASEDLVARLVLLSPFFSLPKSNSLIRISSRIVSNVVPITPKRGRGRINEPEGYRDYTPGSFIISFAAFEQLQRLAVMAGKQVEQIDIPVMIAASSGDVTASFEQTFHLFEPKPNVTFMKYDRSNHILLYDYDKEIVTSKILEFLLSENE
ncbi:MAG: alpha/beta fold hydrolase [Candidatus Electryonea clarkiae]|nr:alpha/beta fold hydrolase [Candidatus Electryonea clarkiae]MDP8289087.1 alpha/beta fold hydrolase [Candidatus Electryonea clarkiae]